MAQQQAEMPAGDVASMYIALLGFTGKVYPDKLDFTDQVLTECYQVTASIRVYGYPCLVDITDGSCLFSQHLLPCSPVRAHKSNAAYTHTCKQLSIAVSHQGLLLKTELHVPVQQSCVSTSDLSAAAAEVSHIS